MKPTLNLRQSILLMLAGLLASLAVFAEPPGWTLQWKTIDGGGSLNAAAGQWQLAGTIGQWDSSSVGAATGGQWSLTGGFWGVAGTDLPELIFRDSFEK